jgi:hypothetical protein
MDLELDEEISSGGIYTYICKKCKRSYLRTIKIKGTNKYKMDFFERLENAIT